MRTYLIAALAVLGLALTLALAGEAQAGFGRQRSTTVVVQQAPVVAAPVLAAPVYGDAFALRVRQRGLFGRRLDVRVGRSFAAPAYGYAAPVQTFAAPVYQQQQFAAPIYSAPALQQSFSYQQSFQQQQFAAPAYQQSLQQFAAPAPDCYGCVQQQALAAPPVVLRAPACRQRAALGY